MPALVAVTALLIAGCSSSGAGAGSGGGDGGTVAAAGPDTSTTASATDKSDRKGSWPPSNACDLVSSIEVATALGESLTSPPRSSMGAYGPNCDYDSAVASPIASVQAFPVEDLKTYTQSLLQRGAVVKVAGIGDSALIALSNPGIADVVLYVFKGSTAFSVQVSVYGGAGAWTSERAKTAATNIVKAIID